MGFYKLSSDGYIQAIGYVNRTLENEITETEFNEIEAVIQAKPTETETLKYRLKTDLTWEQYQIEPPEPSDPTSDDIADILLGGEL